MSLSKLNKKTKDETQTLKMYGDRIKINQLDFENDIISYIVLFDQIWYDGKDICRMGDLTNIKQRLQDPELNDDKIVFNGKTYIRNNGAISILEINKEGAKVKQRSEFHNFMFKNIIPIKQEDDTYEFTEFKECNEDSETESEIDSDTAYNLEVEEIKLRNKELDYKMSENHKLELENCKLELQIKLEELKIRNNL